MKKSKSFHEFMLNGEYYGRRSAPMNDSCFPIARIFYEFICILDNSITRRFLKMPPSYDMNKIEVRRCSVGGCSRTPGRAAKKKRGASIAGHGISRRSGPQAASAMAYTLPSLPTE